MMVGGGGSWLYNVKMKWWRRTSRLGRMRTCMGVKIITSTDTL